MNGKLVGTIQEAIKLCGLQDGMTVSFHHHLRDGDGVLPMVMQIIAELGFKNIRLSASSIHASHGIVGELIKKGVIDRIDTNFLGRSVGVTVSEGHMPHPAILRTHGGRPLALENGETDIDIAFIAASASDTCGNMNGIDGMSVFGSMGHAFADAQHAKKVVVVTDYLLNYPLSRVSIDETYVDYVVKVDSIGDNSGIKSGLLSMKAEPLSMVIAKTAAKVIEHSGMLKDGFNYQNGGGRNSTAVTRFLREIMREKKVKGGFLLGGINSLFVDMVEEGLFNSMLDCQCFDLEAVDSLRRNPVHEEISASRYANFNAKSRACAQLDTVILGATEIDANFDVNVHTESNGIIIGGSGGHSDIAFGSKLTVCVSPLIRARSPIAVDKVHVISTPGHCIDVFISQYGVAVNPQNKDLRDKLKEAKVKLVDMEEQIAIAKKTAGEPKPIPVGDRVVAKIIGYDGKQVDEIRQVIR